MDSDNKYFESNKVIVTSDSIENIDEDSFNSITATDVDNDNKENESAAKKKRYKSPNTTRFQYETLISFEKEYPDGNPSGWENLVDELNGMGPPSHTSVEWNKVWIDYNAKKKQLTKKKMAPLETSEICEGYNKVTDQSSTSHVGQSADITLRDYDYFHSEHLKKLDLIVDQLKSSNEKLDKLINIAESKRNN